MFKDVLSDTKCTTSGVAQSAIFGQLGFLYIHDLPVPSTDCSFDLFTDNSKM